MSTNEINKINFNEFAKKHTFLTDSEIDILSKLNSNLVYTSDLTDSDIFIDVFDKSGNIIVLAEAHPRWAMSNYSNSVVGYEVFQKNEPAVYHTFELGVPIKDLKAETQEGKKVKQDVIPIKNGDGKIFAVLIREKDVSENISREKKYNELIREREKNILPAKPNFVSRETNHRIKNNLQVIASTMRLQAKATDNPDLKIFFDKNIQKVLCIAKIHDILSNIETVDKIEILSLFNRICKEITFVVGDNFKITVLGDELEVSSDIATNVIIVVNELIFNSVEHAFLPDKRGNILVSCQKGNQNVTITVEDDGQGFDIKKVSNHSLGLKIVSQTVKDKLKSELRIMSNKTGTKATFGFRII